MGCCLGGCVRLVGFAVWRAVFAALIAIFLSQIDSYVDRSGKSDSMAGKAWRLYRSRSGKGKRGRTGTRPSVVDTEGGPRT